MNIITYHASDMDTVQNDSVSFAVQLKRKNEYTGGQARQAAVAADMRFFSDFQSTNIPYTKKRVAFNHTIPLMRLNPLPFLLIFSILYAVLAVPLLRSGAGSYPIRTMSFNEEPSLSRAIHSYIFPEQENFADQEAAPVAEGYVSTVTFKDYTVRKGDTISGIASRAGLRNFGTLLSVNNIDNARRISAGQVLRIPSTDGLLYTVKKNETLAGIAAAHKVSVTALLDANDLTQETLAVGQKLFIPGASLSSFELRKALGELFIYPIRGRLTSPFGYRSDPFTGVRSFHSGIDLAAPTGTAVKATLDGKIAETGFNRIFGNYVIITHDRGYQSLYGHLSAIYVKRGQYVTQGAAVGAVGNTGYSTGPHLHLSIYKNGSLINPFSVLK
ncbi:M23 family metallopeptidase [Treponema vincentii]|uniref:peptidoglycan DD-metalloendopeptidase family protein n=1 Tax=Treponema TaxID=157 RepID=UPI001BB0A04D|nr:M23 family metallopeptidase [Treponema vincentii]QUY17163.1 M23 family metallopeptidase [Treponema vincentii]